MSRSIHPGRFFAVVALAFICSPLPPARAIVLTFDPVNANFEHVSQTYGDRVATTPQDGFEYGTSGDFTPNIVVDYGILPDAIPALWTTGYGDLTNILYEDQDGYGHLEIMLTADDSWNVVLDGFDMAAYSPVSPINSVIVRDGEGNVLFSETDVAVSAAGHDAYTFAPGLQGQVIIISLDMSNLGTFSDNVGIDNIMFHQFNAPTPVESNNWGAVKVIFKAR